MPGQIRTTPRKRPTQERSRDTVATILNATARILGKRGFDALTTNAVARAAGVSIGSLYQYFPNKEALVTALTEQHIEDMNTAIHAEFERVATLPIAQAARAIIELTFRAHTIDPELHRVLTDQMPRVGRIAKLRQMDEITHRMLVAVLVARTAEISVRDPDLAAFVLESTIESIVHRAALLYPERLRDPRLVDEATLMVTRYLGVAET